jgi:orotate phosphoribosyltransferase
MTEFKELRLMIKEKSFIKGDFILSSGKTANFFFDLKPVMLDPKGINLIADAILEKIKFNKIDAIGGMEIGAIPLSIAVSLKSNLTNNPMLSFFTRKESKGHGTNKLIEGNLTSEMNILILEDVTTTGGSILKVVNILRNNGFRVNKAVTVVDREAGAEELLLKSGIELFPLFTIQDFSD